MFGRNRQLQELKITLKTLDVSFMKQAPSVSQVQLFASLQHLSVIPLINIFSFR